MKAEMTQQAMNETRHENQASADEEWRNRQKMIDDA